MPDLKPGVPDLKPGVSNLKPGVPDLKPGVPDLKPGVPDLKPGVPDLKPGVPDLKPGVPDLKPGTPGGVPDPEPVSACTRCAATRSQKVANACLLEFYILAASKVISARVSTCAHAWQLYSAAPLG